MQCPLNSHQISFKVMQLSPLSNSRTFSLLYKETLYPQAVIPNSPYLQPLGTSNLLSISVDLPAMDISYKRIFSVCHFVSVCLLLSIVIKGHPCCTAYQYFIPVYGHSMSHHICRPHPT